MKKIVILTLVLFPFLVNACGGDSSGSYTSFIALLVLGATIFLACVLSIFFIKVSKKIKKIARLLICEIGGLPLILTLTYIFFRIENAKPVTNVVNESMNYYAHRLPTGSFYGMAANLIAWYLIILVGVGFIGVIVNSILWIVFRKNEKKSIIKDLLIYSIISIFFGLLVYLLWKASQSTLCAPGNGTF